MSSGSAGSARSADTPPATQAHDDITLPPPGDVAEDEQRLAQIAQMDPQEQVSALAQLYDRLSRMLRETGD
ncbi:hypothetical protein D4740_00015 [Actinomyces sp. 2119]|uniref:Uncharacterized protein n=1 Tax=Actinomyces lilanjuaniae TaxID=2321394 RepID=A0ABM6Z2U4_9ACTO|nr:MULTISPECIES: hypothetical protein [Actinomyces]AYD89631.1 hypothetical protein D5R93_05465 [Actinomyces lilanjuaniae]RJF44632.1 hypothetical protein D4740_00015 [Actinomyces sp. 2119]